MDVQNHYREGTFKMKKDIVNKYLVDEKDVCPHCKQANTIADGRSVCQKCAKELDKTVKKKDELDD